MIGAIEKFLGDGVLAWLLVSDLTEAERGDAIWGGGGMACICDLM